VRHYPRKITTSSIGLETSEMEKLAADHGKAPISVARVYGRIASYETETSQFGNAYRRFKGEFEAVNLITSDVYRAQAMILPDTADTALMTQYEIARAKADKEGPCIVEVGVDLTIEQFSSSKGGVKFRWGCKPLREPSEDDSLSRLGKEFGALPLLTKEPDKKTRK